MRRTKTIGIAVAMALALTAFVGVASASASEFESPGRGEGEVTTWKGSLSGKNHKLELGDDSMSCAGVAFAGEMTGQHAAEITVTPELSSCNWLGFSVGWTINSCKYRLHPGSSSEENRTVGSLDIVGCKAPMTFIFESCRLEIGNQNGIGTVEYKNTETAKIHTVAMVANLSGITYTRHGSCISSLQGTFHNGTYTGEWLGKGFTTKAGQVGVQIHGSVLPPPTKFAAEEAPVTIAGLDGSMLAKKRLSPLGGNGLVCTKYTLNGTSSSITSEALTLTPTYKECTVGGEKVPDNFVSSGGCSYVFHANGKFDIAGATCASNPITITRAGCIATVGPQSGLPGITFKNEGSGKLRTISMSGNVEGITYTTEGPNCNIVGTYSTGKFESDANLSATNSTGASQGISIE